MPVGGVGTGNFAIGADGGLRQWQLQNMGNHLGEAPWTFFALRVSQIEPPLDQTLILQDESVADQREATPLVTDNMIPAWQRELLELRPGFKNVAMTATYPVAELRFESPGLPVVVTETVLSPLVPMDAEDSGIPAAMFTFTITNTGNEELHGFLGGAMQNMVGGDGITNPVGVRHPGYGGNSNRLRRSGWTKLIAENLSLPVEDARTGQMVLATDDNDARAFLQWTDPQQYLDYLDGAHPRVTQSLSAAQRRTDPSASSVQMDSASRPSPAGSTWCGSLTVPWVLQPGESTTIRFMLAWHFPNRYVNYDHFGPGRPEWGATRFWLGNEYAARYTDAEHVADDVAARWDDLTRLTRGWTSTLTGTSLPPRVAGMMAAQPIAVRTPTSFVAGDGTFYGFEGTLGESTKMWAGAVGGSCPLNCTHVWNYEQAMAYLSPSLEQSMRETEFGVMQAPDGYIPHRVIAPAFLPQLWDTAIDGPTDPALDGMLGAVLKTYREARNGAGEEFIQKHWSQLSRLMDYIKEKWDTEGDGVLRGIQPSTHDIDLCGINSYMGTLWLAALRAMEEMALIVGDEERASRSAAMFRNASQNYDRLLWNGEYYEQVLLPGESTDYQWVHGCLSDQLIGQWWAHELGLGHVLPETHVREALKNVVRYNMKDGFEGFEHPFRVYADRDDSGLLMCTWPNGGRPPVPTRYADEVWTGIEYQVAAHCLREGLAEEAERILNGMWGRHDGRRRNPFNEIECGDHYARAMAGWSVLRALSGVDYDSITETLTIKPVREMLEEEEGALVLPFFAGEAWGTIILRGEEVSVELRAGDLPLKSIEVV